MIVSKVAGSNIMNKLRKIKAIVFGKDDVREPNEVAPYGYDASPVNDIYAVYSNTNTIGVPIIIGYFNKQQKAQTGESRIFATDSTGVFKYNVWLRADGTVLIGDSDEPSDYTNFLVKFNELKTGFDTLRTEVNSMVTVFNAHVHPASVPVLITATPQTSATATIDSSKATKIKTK